MKICSGAARHIWTSGRKESLMTTPWRTKVEAGADMFLMPSRYETFGLNQMYSLKYGTVAIVRAPADWTTASSRSTCEARGQDRVQVQGNIPGKLCCLRCGRPCIITWMSGSGSDPVEWNGEGFFVEEAGRRSMRSCTK